MKLCWHIHHNRLLEPLTEPVENRIASIKKYKPAHEIETRLRLMKLVEGELPPAVVRAAEACGKAEEAFDKAWKDRREAYGEAWEDYGKAQEALYKTLTDHRAEIESLHDKECPDCPWNGEEIVFPDSPEEETA